MKARLDETPWKAPEYVVEILNTDQTDPNEAQLQAELKLWVDAWLDSRRNLQIMARQLGQAKANAFFEHISCSLSITDSGEPSLIVLPYRSESEDIEEARGPDPQWGALTFFRQLILHPESWKVGGPCPRCGKYFLKKTRHVKHKYCSRAHGSDISARNWTKKRLDEEHAALLLISRNALKSYEQLPPEIREVQTWQEFVLEEVRKSHPERKMSSLTRWVNDEKREAGSGLSVPEHLKIKGDR
jgi:uncharacterized C2H2 Zn-finger protein